MLTKDLLVSTKDCVRKLGCHSFFTTAPPVSRISASCRVTFSMCAEDLYEFTSTSIA
uniref:Uncharacterized protein n=1 Tax=Arundo donax TaxID=35708 RepID=A0A0A9HJX8_ARUDO